MLGSLGLGALGVLLGLSIGSFYVNPWSVLSLPGSFFVHSYGVLAFLIPVYLLFATFILADPVYRPNRIFILGGFIIPFFTIALGFYWIREFETVGAASLLGRFGKPGIGFSVFLLTALETAGIISLYSALFGRKKSVGGICGKARRGVHGEVGARSWPEPIENRLGKAPQSPAEKLRDIYAAAAAAVSAEEEVARVPVVAEQGQTPKRPREGQTLGERREGQTIVCPPGIDVRGHSAEGSEISDRRSAIDTGKQSGLALDREEIPPAASPRANPLAAPVPSPTSLARPDEDVEKALAVAEAHSAEEAARHEGQTSRGQTLKWGQTRKGQTYSVPVEGILRKYPDGEYWIIDDETRDAALTLKETFKEFNIQVEVTGIRKGPVITMFEILPAPGIRLNRIENLADNIALRLAAQSVRIVAPIPGKHAVGIEVPNAKRNIVSFREIIEAGDGKNAEVPVVLGKDITGEAVTVDLVQMPHLLIAGATGSGKSVCVNAMILTILYRKPPSECRLILIDPKIVELKLYNDIPHLLTPVITEPKKAFQALQYCIYEMERRYACLDSMGVRDIRSYNRRIKEREIATEYMPYIVVVIDEFADLMATTGKELEQIVARLAAMSRAVGIHLVLATQRPSIDIITGLIKANIPSRIAFMVAGRMNSQIIIDSPGAEKLLGKGDMLYSGAVDPFPIRMQGAFVSEEEVERVVGYVKTLGEPDYIDDEIFYDEDEEETDPSLFSEGDDPLYEKALEIVMQQGRASASYIQRRLKIGYNRAARLVEEMEHHGVVGPAQGSKPREILRGVM
ncbi:MAG: DNA translocase FtsK [Treponema sp.]|nr:DNA translocase FtsK [Treponema sp.]